MTNIIGVDVGKFGCLVSLSDPNNYLLMPMMENPRDGVDMDAILDWHKTIDFPDHPLTVCIEQQWTFGREGRVSIASLMLQYGQLWGYYQGYEPRIIPVSVWKKHHGIKGKGRIGKQRAIDKVIELYPNLKWPKRFDSKGGVADAILIAKYGAETE